MHMYTVNTGPSDPSTDQGSFDGWMRDQGSCHTMMVQGSGFRVDGSEFRVEGLGFRVEGLGFVVEDSGFRVQGSGFGVRGFRFRSF